MRSLSFRHREPLARLALVCLLLTLSLVTSGCATLFGVKRTVAVPPLLSPLREAETAQLVAEVNRLASIRSLRGKVDIEFQDTSFAEAGLAEKYRTADGTVILQRPGQIFISIQAPFVGTDIAQMTSDGEHFRVAVLKGDEKYRRFARGTNNAAYVRLENSETKDARADNKKKKGKSDARTVSVLSSLRPQHFTDALLIRPIAPRTETGFVYSRSEFYQEEADTRPQAQPGTRVVRGYYLLDELAPGGESGVRPTRRFWFDRVGGIRLARLQTFDQSGMLVTDVSYGELKSVGEAGNLQLPTHVELTRPQDHYKISLTYQSPEAIVLDRQYDAQIFVLENKWQLKEVDLDAPKGSNK
ncbi:MAG TPA: hypothetical protein VGB17_05910 [Pyrinomonadaceae bacterium]|jgi:hypothetical protein